MSSDMTVMTTYLCVLFEVYQYYFIVTWPYLIISLSSNLVVLRRWTYLYMYIWDYYNVIVVSDVHVQNVFRYIDNKKDIYIGLLHYIIWNTLHITYLLVQCKYRKSEKVNFITCYCNTCRWNLCHITDDIFIELSRWFSVYEF